MNRVRLKPGDLVRPSMEWVCQKHGNSRQKRLERREQTTGEFLGFVEGNVSEEWGRRCIVLWGNRGTPDDNVWEIDIEPACRQGVLSCVGSR